MDRRVDLHMHTNYSSDGDHKPEEVLSKARAAGLCAISIADHDSTAGSREAVGLSDKYGVEVVPNVEVTTFHEGRELHVLAYFVKYDSRELQDQLTSIHAFEEARMEEYARRLQTLGVDVTYAEAKELSPLAPPKCSILIKAALDNGRNTHNHIFAPYTNGDRAGQPYHNFFLDYMRSGKTAYVEPARSYPTVDAIQLIHRSRGLPVLAHPAGSLPFPACQDTICSLQDEGLVGVEVYSSYHTEAQEALLASHATARNLLITAGSDFHGFTVKPEIAMGDLRFNPYSIVEKLKRAHTT